MRTLFTTLLLMLAALPARGEGGYCFDEAAQRYDVPAALLWAVAKVESNFDPTAVNWNKNGSLDYGLMQINSTWLKTIGEERWKALGDPCFNIQMGAFVMSDCLRRYGYTYEGIGCYNATTYEKRIRYAHKVVRAMGDLAKVEK